MPTCSLVSRSKPRHENGMVTAEFATIMPFAVAFTLLLLWIVTLGLTQVRMTDAAREGARLVARGETAATAQQAARRLAPDSTVKLKVESSTVTVTVTDTPSFQIPGLPKITGRTQRATSIAVLEAP